MEDVTGLGWVSVGQEGAERQALKQRDRATRRPVDTDLKR
jgi:hypothetical protein